MGAALRLACLVPAIGLQLALHRLVVLPMGAELPFWGVAIPFVGVAAVALWHGARARGVLELLGFAAAGALLFTAVDLAQSFTIGRPEERALITDRTALWLGLSLPLWAALLGSLSLPPFAVRRWLLPRR